MNNAAALPNPQAFAFGLLNANTAADAVDSKLQVEGEKKGINAVLSSDCCSSNNYGAPQ